ncbi:MAG TPA: high-affinity branched-chain amino acid ABC transporter ATP-binding protein LivG, partial [Cupriavidus sp.]|nr:high-affinity branched-chain amino acid ABC transporter ATP-binding protein LivG [Cupriavidus sp.]
MSAEMLKVSGLQMRFGGLLAVDGIEFDVRRDEVFAIIGPNG